VVGRSGKHHRFDFVVRSFGKVLLLDAVAPHHISIASKYVAFADMAQSRNKKFAVHDRRLESEDISLLQQVADIVPVTALEGGIKRLVLQEWSQT
jgi:hypothetical protein